MNEEQLDERIRGYDWQAVFEYCGPVEGDYSVCAGNEEASVSAALNSSAKADPFTRADVAEVLATSDGERDEAQWLGVFRLKDGRFAFVSAGCDYTGWDCRSGGYAIVSHSLEHLLQFGIGEAERARLGLVAA
ncbi:MAG TPA: hypothetical protein VJN18_35665 [Polyangiaceae bacterium]|nr:hypothetical protein [Polyangiaceae bacterium]